MNYLRADEGQLDTTEMWSYRKILGIPWIERVSNKNVSRTNESKTDKKAISKICWGHFWTYNKCLKELRLIWTDLFLVSETCQNAMRIALIVSLQIERITMSFIFTEQIWIMIILPDNLFDISIIQWLVRDISFYLQPKYLLSSSRNFNNNQAFVCADALFRIGYPMVSLRLPTRK